jgi:hypothetical protein
VVAEAGLARGAHAVICLALPPCEFEQHSVSLPGSDWSARFRRLLELAEVRQLSHEVDSVPEGDAVFTRANAWIVDIARQLSRTPYAVIVWDGEAGDGPGGTSDLVARLGYPENDPRLRVIDPTPRT